MAQNVIQKQALRHWNKISISIPGHQRTSEPVILHCVPAKHHLRLEGGWVCISVYIAHNPSGMNDTSDLWRANLMRAVCTPPNAAGLFKG